MKRKFVLLAPAGLAVPASAQTMEPGEWQFSSTTNSPMLQRPSELSFTLCVSKADADDPMRFTADGQTKGCEVVPGERTAEPYSWTVVWPGGMRGNGSARFRGTTIESEWQVSYVMQGQTTEVRTWMAGRHLGPCRTKQTMDFLVASGECRYNPRPCVGV